MLRSRTIRTAACDQGGADYEVEDAHIAARVPARARPSAHKPQEHHPRDQKVCRCAVQTPERRAVRKTADPLSRLQRRPPKHHYPLEQSKQYRHRKQNGDHPVRVSIAEHPDQSPDAQHQPHQHPDQRRVFQVSLF